MQYFCYERRAAAHAWIACLYPESPGTSLTKVRRGPIHEVGDEMTLRECMKRFDPPADPIAAVTPAPKPKPATDGAVVTPEPAPAEEPVPEFKSRRSPITAYDRG